MKVAIVKTRIDRHTGETLSSEVEGFTEMSEEEYYQPLVEMFYKAFKESEVR